MTSEFLFKRFNFTPTKVKIVGHYFVILEKIVNKAAGIRNLYIYSLKDKMCIKSYYDIMYNDDHFSRITENILFDFRLRNNNLYVLRINKDKINEVIHPDANFKITHKTDVFILFTKTEFIYYVDFVKSFTLDFSKAPEFLGDKIIYYGDSYLSMEKDKNLTIIDLEKKKIHLMLPNFSSKLYYFDNVFYYLNEMMLMGLGEDTSSVQSNLKEKECAICFDGFNNTKKKVVLVPCGHTNFCNNCTLMINKCPTCQSVIERKVVLYD